MGDKVGKIGITEFEEKGRILIPKQIREELMLKPGQKVLVEAKDQELIIKPSKNIDKFISELSGCVKRSKIKPLEIKKIWKM